MSLGVEETLRPFAACRRTDGVVLIAGAIALGGQLLERVGSVVRLAHGSDSRGGEESRLVP